MKSQSSAQPHESLTNEAQDISTPPLTTISAATKNDAFSNETPPLIPEREQISLRRDWLKMPLTAVSKSAVESSLFPQKSQSEKSANHDLSSTTSPADQATKPVPAQCDPATQIAEVQNFRILGVLGKLYVLMENREGLVLVDQHAAHERILFEELRKRLEDQGVPVQRLLMPLTIQLSPRDADWTTQNLEAIHRMGIGIEPFGAGTFKIDALPQFIRVGDPLQLVHDIIDELSQTSASSSKLRLGEDVIATTVCRHAVKANDVLREPELVRLIQDLLACELPYCCPHGRPTMIQISYSELEKKFGRKV